MLEQDIAGVLFLRERADEDTVSPTASIAKQMTVTMGKCVGSEPETWGQWKAAGMLFQILEQRETKKTLSTINTTR